MCPHYTFENGDIVEMCDNSIIFFVVKTSIRHTYTVGLLFKSKFIKIFNQINNVSRQRKGNSNNVKSRPKSNDPNKERYEKLKDSIKLREEQLGKMAKTDPERTALENELDNYKKAAERIKSKHQFENIKSFESFFKI